MTAANRNEMFFLFLSTKGPFLFYMMELAR
jgi:hypothetical protein